MTIREVLEPTAGGVRAAVAMLGIMTIYAWAHTPRPNALIDAMKTRTGLLWAIAAITYSPVRAALNLGYAVPEWVRLVFDLAASSIACLALINMLATRALERTVPLARVRRARLANASIPILFVIGAWIAR